MVIKSPKITIKMKGRITIFLNSLVEGTTLLNTVTKCGGIESREDPKTRFEQ